jgi:5-formyltetrahydrofolate cyclo-ligase
MAMSKVKSALRQHWLSKRLNLPADEREILTAMLVQHAQCFLSQMQIGLLQQERIVAQKAGTLAFGSEFSFEALMDDSWVLPKTLAQTKDMLWFPWQPLGEREEWVKSKYGIWEAPLEACKPCDASSSQPWLVLVPALTASPTGCRLGYGGGFYDKFLKEYAQSVISFCLLPESFLSKNLPKESHDTAVDFIVTEKRIIRCTNSLKFNSFATLSLEGFGAIAK